MQTSIPANWTLGELRAGLDELPVAEREDGFYSHREWARMWGISDERARRNISDFVEAQRMEASYRTSYRADGQRCRTPVYRVRGG